MKSLFIKQQLISIGDNFTIYDEYNNPIYTVREKLISFRKRFFVYNREGVQFAEIYQRIIALMPTFCLVINGTEYLIIKKFTFFLPSYFINGLNWTIQGDFLNHDFVIKDLSNHTIASIHKRYIALSDSYEIKIEDGYNEELVAAAVIAIDAVIEICEEYDS